MCAFRDPIVKRCVITALAGLLPAAAAANDAATPSPYLPLAVGNSWTYRCSVDGNYQFDKTIRLTSAVVPDGTRYYRAEMRVKRDPQPSVYYLTADASGSVFRSRKPSGEGKQLVITAMPSIGDKVGALTVAATERIDTPAIANVEALRVENFSRDDPQLPSDKRAEWRGRFYARGVGQVAEADGSGGECVLLKFHLEQPR